jgi:hypothetical protein
MCLFTIGGQRREIIVAFSTQVIIFHVYLFQNIKYNTTLKTYTMNPPVEKVIRKESKTIPIPNWLGDIIFYFRDYVRDTFVPQTDLAMWLNIKGKPLGKFYFI